MEILSSARSTILSEYPNLKTKYVHQQMETENIDFQVFPLRRLFVEVNKKSGLELLHIKDYEDRGPEISRVKKLKMDNLYCAACPKQGHEELALGYSNGIIRLINYKSSEFTGKFPADNPRNGIVYLDFNASNEYLCSVQENGLITLYGLKTKAKLETLNFDNNCTLSRFHPTKRFQMTVASYKGSVFVYDIQSSRRIFQSLDCHGAPCKDICMSPAQPDVLLSVGFDCVINIFDIRRKTPPQQIIDRHPLSTVAISDCGYFACVGNLKGELISYDLRNTKRHLNSAKVHDSAVVRVAFVPAINNFGESSNSVGCIQSNVDTNSELRKSVAINEKRTQPKRDSFCDFLEFHSYKLKVANNRFSVRRDSFDWELLSRKNSDFRASMASRSDGDSLHNFDSKSRNYVDFVSVEETEEEGNRNDSKTILAACTEKTFPDRSDMRVIQHDIDEQAFVDATRNTENNITPSEINAKPIRVSESTADILRGNKLSQDEGSDKENMLNLLNKDIEGFLRLPEDRNSTPNNYKRSIEHTISPVISSFSTQDLMTELQKIRTEMDCKFKQLESEIRYVTECNKWNMFTQNWNLWRKQMDVSEEIQASVECLLQTDPFVSEFLRLQKENEHLKKVLSELKKQK